MTPSWRDNNVVVLGVNALKSNLYMKFVVNAISARANFEFYEGWIGVDFERSTMHTTISDYLMASSSGSKHIRINSLIYKPEPKPVRIKPQRISKPQAST